MGLIAKLYREAVASDDPVAPETRRLLRLLASRLGYKMLVFGLGKPRYKIMCVPLTNS